MCAKWSVDFADVDKLTELISKIPNKSEEIINKTLETKAVPLAKQNIEKRINLSKNWKGQLLNKNHAQTAGPFVAKMSNLGFELVSKPKFNYLIFPDQGVGKNNKTKQDFMLLGLEESTAEIVEMLEEDVLKEINNILGGN
ncbi:hypothetical protein ACEXFN_001078 [Listeria monocytogenes]|uniref:Uncharacterized protein n=3 Tax=root TaxID=1 RepID=R4IBU7_9CAUD|nr:MULTISPECIES: hypothetical protein [Listeria]YP_008126706.1 neck protein [Listeria phage LP-030-2]AFN39948.1 hypothetical protein LP030nr2_010 [Listeria phage LP-030-2]AVV12596.1 hypothetical protein CXL10_06925 [Listeria monocytogenes]AXO75364.1 hypothetical protein CYD36_05310 [Listeria monocytogenes]EAA0055290.1 hypothetical protein [Listeria monocytogenes]EAA0076081.1 hypothetical protein [Listeria monocytogenes]